MKIGSNSMTFHAEVLVDLPGHSFRRDLHSHFCISSIIYSSLPDCKQRYVGRVEFSYGVSNIRSSVGDEIKSVLFFLLILFFCTSCLGWGFVAHWQISVAALDLLESSILNSIRGDIQEDVFKNWIGAQASCVDVDKYFVRELVSDHTFLSASFPEITSLSLEDIKNSEALGKNAFGALIDAFFDIREYFEEPANLSFPSCNCYSFRHCHNFRYDRSKVFQNGESHRKLRQDNHGE